MDWGGGPQGYGAESVSAEQIRETNEEIFMTYLVKELSASPSCSSLIKPKRPVATLGIPIVTHSFIKNSRKRLLRKRRRSREAYSGCSVM